MNVNELRRRVAELERGFAAPQDGDVPAGLQVRARLQRVEMKLDRLDARLERLTRPGVVRRILRRLVSRWSH